MANMIIKPAAGGNLLIQDRAGGAVLSTGTSGHTLNAPTIANMANCTFPAGHLLQVLYHQQTSSDSNTTTTSTTYSTIAGLSKAITVLATSKVYIQVLVHIYLNAGQNSWNTANLKIFRDSTEVHLPAGSNPYVHGKYSTDQSDRDMQFASLHYLDTPGSAGTFTYHTKISAKNGHSVGVHPTDQMGFSNITLMEIAG